MNSDYDKNLRRQKFLRIQERLFRLLGYDIYAPYVPGRVPWRTMIALLPMLLVIPIGAFTFNNLTDIDALTDSLCPLLMGSLCLLKMLLFVAQRKKFISLVGWICDELERVDKDKAAAGEMSSSREEQMNAEVVYKENRSGHFMSRVTCWFAYITATAATLLPFVDTIVEYRNTGKIVPYLPFPSYFPWDSKSTHGFILSYAWQAAATYTTATIVAAVDSLFCCVAYNVCAQFRIAQRRISAIRPSPRMDANQAVNDILKLHQAALQIAADINISMQPLLFVQYSISSMQICVLGYQAVSKLDEPRVLFFCLLLVVCTFQIYVYSYCGERIKSQSFAFATAISDGYWYEFYEHDTRLARTFTVALMRAQRVCNLDGYFFEANLTTFTSIMSTAMSYITLLRSLEE